MAHKTLQQVTEDEVVHKLASIMEVIDISAHQASNEPVRDWICEAALKQVWGVREAKTKLSNLLHDASGGEIHFVTAGNGAAIALVSAKYLAEAVSSMEGRKGLTLADAINQLPYSPSDLKPVKLRHRPPARGILRRARAGAGG